MSPAVVTASSALWIPAPCNASTQTGCSTVATTTVGAAPRFMTIAKGARTLYVANKDSDTLSMVNIATCNARNTAGCAGIWPDVRVGHLP